MPTEQIMNSLVINKVDKTETLNAMKKMEDFDPSQVYVVEDPLGRIPVTTEEVEDYDTWIEPGIDASVLKYRDPDSGKIKKVGYTKEQTEELVNNRVDAKFEELDPADIGAANASDLTAHTGNKSNPHGVTAAQTGAAPTSRKVNGKALSADITLSAADVGAFGVFNKSIPSGDNLDNYLEQGSYYVTGTNASGIANMPRNTAMHLYVFRADTQTGASDTKRTLQIATPSGIPDAYCEMYYRKRSESGWSAWKTIATTDYAVNKAGDIMTGALAINPANTTGVVSISADNTITMIQSYIKDGWANRRFLQIPTVDAPAGYNQLDYVGMGSDAFRHHILHTGNKNLITAADVGAFAKSDGIGMNNGDPIVFPTSASGATRLRLYSGRDAAYDGGAGLILTNKNASSSAGSFTLTAHDGTNSAALSGTPSGALSWKGNLIYHAGNKPTLTDLGITATAAELNYVDGVTSSIQTQLNSKASTATATTSAAGLMSAADKKKLDGIATGATANTGDITGVTAGTGLTGGGTSGSVTLSVSYGTTAGTACQGNDSRLSNARTPTAHKHSASEITSGTLSVARGGTGVTSLTNLLKAMFPSTATATYIPVFGSSWGSAGYATPATLKTAMGAASTTTYNATVTTSWTASGEYFYQNITVNGITANDNPIVAINTGTDNAANKLYSESLGKVIRIVTAANKITVYATEAIGTAFPIQLKVVR